MSKIKTFIPLFFFIIVISLIAYLQRVNSIAYIGVPTYLSKDIRVIIHNQLPLNTEQRIKSFYFYNKYFDTYILKEPLSYTEYLNLKDLLIDGGIYYKIHPKLIKKISLPKRIPRNDFQRYILNKLTNREELIFLKKKFKYEKKFDSYYLEKIIGNDKSQLITILIGSGYFNDFIDRGFETPTKKVLNYYLGSFFNFYYVGLFNWLILPIFILLILKKKFKKIELHIKVLLLTYTLMLLLIIVKFGHNPRYQLSLLPFSLYIVLIFVWRYVKSYLIIFRKYLYIVTIVLLLTIIMYLGFYYYKKDDTVPPSIKKENSIILNFDKYSNFVKSKIQEPKEGIQEIVSNLKLLPPSSYILVNNLPAFFYYTNLKGIFYWSGSDIYYGREGPKTLLGEQGINHAYEIIKNKLGLTHILSSKYYNYNNQKFLDFLNSYTEVVFSNNTFAIYRIL